VYKKVLARKGIKWLHKFCIKKLPTGERVHKKYHFHNKRCASCWHSVKDDDHFFTCMKRKRQRTKIVKQINVMRNTVDIKLYDIRQEGLMTYSKGECMTGVQYYE
jgi:hypothetical protein